MGPGTGLVGPGLEPWPGPPHSPIKPKRQKALAGREETAKMDRAAAKDNPIRLGLIYDTPKVIPDPEQV